MNNHKIIEISGISFVYDNMPVLTDIDLDVYDGDFLAITGPNGGGKTTLLRIVLGLLPATEGQVRFFRDGKAVSYLNMGYLPQKNGIDSRFPLTVSEVIYSGLMGEKHRFGSFSPEQNQRVDEVLFQVGLEDLKDRPIGRLSGGQLQRALLGRTLVSRPEVLLLDEPSSYVDQSFENKMYDLLKEINKSTTILWVSHELDRIAEVANRTVRINRSIQEISG